MAKKEGEIDLAEVPEYPGPKKGIIHHIKGKFRKKNFDIPDLPVPEVSKELISSRGDIPLPDGSDGLNSITDLAPGDEQNAFAGEEITNDKIDELKGQLEERLQELNKKKSVSPDLGHRTLQELNQELQKINNEIKDIHI